MTRLIWALVPCAAILVSHQIRGGEDASAPKSNLGAPSPTASFDCKKARSPTEKMICSSPNLSTLDAQLAEAYKKAKKELTTAVGIRIARDQLSWLKLRDRCTDAECLEQTYNARINELDPFVDDHITCEEMRRWSRQVFDTPLDLGSGRGSPVAVDYACPESLGERDFMKDLLALAEEIRGDDGPQECSGSLAYALRRYYLFELTQGGMAPRSLPAWPSVTTAANWATFLQEDDTGTAIYFRQWSEQSHANQMKYKQFAIAFDKAAAELKHLYVTTFGLPTDWAASASKRALSAVALRAAGAASKSESHEEFPLLDVLRSGPADPAQVRKAVVGLDTRSVERALRVALMHNQPTAVVAALDESLPREVISRIDPPAPGDSDDSKHRAPEPLLSLALGHTPNLDYLLQRRYPVDSVNDFGKTALFYAIGRSDHAAVELLLQYRADANHTYKSGKELHPDGYFCGRYPYLTHTQRSPLMHAAQNSDVRMMQLLLKAGANLNARDDLVFNAYDYAAMGNKPENVAYLASLGLSPAAPKYSGVADPAVRDHKLSRTLTLEGYVKKLVIPTGRHDLLIASVLPLNSVDGGPHTGLYLLSLANPAEPRIVGIYPGVYVYDFAASPDGKRIYFIEMSYQGSASTKRYGLSVLDSSDPAHPRVLAQVEGDFMTMHLSPDGRTLYLQERKLQPQFSRGLLVHDVSTDVPTLRCRNPFGEVFRTPVFAYGFASFPDEPTTAIAEASRLLMLFNTQNPCKPVKLMETRSDFNPSSMIGGKGRTLLIPGLKKLRLTEEPELQASYQVDSVHDFHVNTDTGITALELEDAVAILRTTPDGTYVLTDRLRLPEGSPVSPGQHGAVISTASGHIYVGWSGGLGAGAFPLQ
jgi:uncharacterized protein